MAYSLPEPRVSPPEPEKPIISKHVTLYIRFTGVKEIEMDVPLDLDLKDSTALTDYLNEWTKEHRPTYATSDPEDWKFTNWIIGEFWQEGEPSVIGGFKDPGKGSDEARIFIEGVEI